MNSRLIVRMASGVAHAIDMPTLAADQLRDELVGVWTGRRAGPTHTLHLADGSSVTINPHHVESVELH
jgi:hypothetical protein